MGEKDFLRYLAKHAARAKPGPFNAAQSSNENEQNAAYKEFQASELYCPKCRRAVPAREKHLLYLPAGDLFDYTCPQCGTSVGSRRTGPQ